MPNGVNLSELVEMSNRYGKNEDYVLAGGGNTSVKDETTLYVKCSGTSLADITEDGFVAMDRRALSALMEKDYPKDDTQREAEFLKDVMAARTDSNAEKRPSVEALLHSLFPQKFVLHIHPALVNGLTCAKEGQTEAARLLGDDVLWIPLCRPGYTLGKICHLAMSGYEKQQGRKAAVLLLQNHGIFVAGESVEEIDGLFSDVETRLQSAVNRRPDADEANGNEKQKLLKAAEDMGGLLGIGVEPLFTKEAVRFCENEESAKPLMRPFTPDHIVYCGPFPLYIRDVSEVKEQYMAFEKSHGFPPKIILVEGVGAFAADPLVSTRQKAKLLLADAMKVAVYSESFGGPLPMTEELTDFILHWEAESYRKSKSG